MTNIAKTIWTELLHASPVFTTAEVARAAGTRLSNASRDLSGLAEAGMVRRIRRGLWAIPNHPDFSPYAVIPHLFAPGDEGYVSLLSALNLHGMIEQIPRVVHVVAARQRRSLVTSVARYEFHQVQPDLFDGFGPYRHTGHFDIATPAKALFDTLYLSVRKGQRFAHLPELELTNAFSSDEMDEWIGRIAMDSLQTAVRDRWRALKTSGT